MNQTTMTFLLILSLGVFSGEVDAVEESLWKGVTAVTVTSDNPAVKIAIEAELRRFRVPVTSELGRNDIALFIYAYTDVMDARHKNGQVAGLVYSIRVKADTPARTLGGGFGFVSIYSNRTFGTAEAGADISRITKPTFVEWATEMANAYLKDNP